MNNFIRVLLIILVGHSFAALATAQTDGKAPPSTTPTPGVPNLPVNPYLYWLFHHHPPYMPQPYPVPVPYAMPGSTVVNNYYTPSYGSGNQSTNQQGSQSPYQQTQTPQQTTAVLPQPVSGLAVVAVKLPTTAAVVWVDGQKMESGLSATRVFTTSAVESGHSYQYLIKAQWVRRGENVSQERTVLVEAGRTTVVDFTRSERNPSLSSQSGY